MTATTNCTPGCPLAGGGACSSRRLPPRSFSEPPAACPPSSSALRRPVGGARAVAPAAGGAAFSLPGDSDPMLSCQFDEKPSMSPLEARSSLSEA